MNGKYWYNGEKTNLERYIFDLNTILIGYPVIRQLRVTTGKNFFNMVNLMKTFILYLIKIYLEKCTTRRIESLCHPDYSFLNDDKNDYGYFWYSSDNSFTNNTYYDTKYNITNPGKILKAFGYTSSLELKNLPIFTKYNDYFGGGYVFKLETQSSNDLIMKEISILKELSWIDKRTRAVIIELNLYNINLNLFSYNSIVFEILPTGSVLKFAKFNPLFIYNTQNDPSGQFSIAFNVLLILMITFFMIKEIRSMIKLGKSYFLQFWNYFEWTIIACSWASLGIYLNRIYAKNELIEYLKGNHDKYINFQLTSSLNDTLNVLFGICSFIGILKFLKIIRYSRNIKYLQLTFKKMSKDLIMFFILFMAVYLSFVQIIYLFLNEKNIKYSTVLRTMETLFLVLLGSFKKEDFFLSNDMLLVTIIFIFYNLFMVIIILNILISMITDYYDLTRKDPKSYEHEIVIIDFVIAKMKEYIRKFKDLNKKEEAISRTDEYKNTINSFEEKSIQLLEKIEKKI